MTSTTTFLALTTIQAIYTTQSNICFSLAMFLALSNQSLTFQEQNNVMHDPMNIFFTHVHHQIRPFRYLIWIINPSKAFDFAFSGFCINPLAIRPFLNR